MYLPADDLKVLALAIDRVVDIVDAGMTGLEDGLSRELQAGYADIGRRSPATAAHSRAPSPACWCCMS
jgi:hypothetical protein